MELTEDLFYLIGALRDGSVNYDKASRNYYIVWYSKDREYMAKIAAKVANVFKKNTSIYEYKEGQYRVRIGSREIYNYIKSVFDFPDEGIGQVEWGTPKILREATLPLKNAYIRGIFDAEGDVSLRNRYLEVSQKNTEILKWIKDELNCSGIHTGGIVIADKRSSTYKFVISGKKDVKIFREIIGFEHGQKTELLDQLCLN